MVDDVDKILSDEALLESKKLAQIMMFIGDGHLKNNSKTSISFRKFLNQVSNDFLIKYAQECLEEGFKESGFALQDIVNIIGSRLGFTIEHGLYQSVKNDIGYDGIWNYDDGFSIVIEVKTTDAYRIQLDRIAEYQKRLIGLNRIVETSSSILIVVGRDDTGELEAQIRGSKHAWDIRIISIDSLLKLLKLKESLSDYKTAQQISIALRPYEYTRVDKLIELLFLTAKDVEVEENIEEIDEIDQLEDKEDKKTEKTQRQKPVSFHNDVIIKLKAKKNLIFIKQSKSSYRSGDEETGLILAISKTHPAFNSAFENRYWFAFHPHQDDFLKKYKIKYVCFGCGDPDHAFLISYDFIEKRLEYMWQTKNSETDYRHIVIYRKKDKFFLRTNVDGKEKYDDLSVYLI